MFLSCDTVSFPYGMVSARPGMNEIVEGTHDSVENNLWEQKRAPAEGRYSPTDVEEEHVANVSSITIQARHRGGRWWISSLETSAAISRSHKEILLAPWRDLLNVYPADI